MAMSATVTGANDPIIEMNTTPLIDVLLVLLIMFIITLPILTHSTSLQIQSGPSTGVVPPVIYVDIDFDGAVSWNGVLVNDFGELERYFRHEGAKASQADLQVRPDRRARYDTVARVLALAQRNGMKRIGVSGVDER